MINISKFQWELPFETRQERLLSRPQKVMYYATTPNPGSFRYRAYHMASALENETNDISASYFFEDDGLALFDLVRHVDRVVLQRTLYTDFVARLILVARRFDVPVFFDIDDYVFEPTAIPLLVSTLDEMPASGESTDVWNAWFGWAARFRMLMDRCDKVITTTEFLAEKVRQKTKLSTSVVRNFLSQEELMLADSAKHSAPKPPDYDLDSMTIGYFSGTNTHQRDLEVASPAIAEFLSDNPKTNFRLVGIGDLEAAGLARFSSQVEHFDLVDYRELPTEVSKVDVNIAPALVNAITSSKSEIRYFNAAAVGVPTIASPTAPMASAITHGVNGWLASPDEWYDNLQLAADYREGGDRTLIENAKTDAVEHYSTAGVIGDLLRALEFNSNGRPVRHQHAVNHPDP